MRRGREGACVVTLLSQGWWNGISKRQRVIAFLVASPADLTSLVAISSVFSYPRIDGRPAYVTKVLTMHTEREIRSRDGLTLANCIAYGDYSGPIDTLVVLGDDTAMNEPPSDVLRWIRRRTAEVRRIVAVSAGAFWLAPTGALDGK